MKEVLQLAVFIGLDILLVASAQETACKGNCLSLSNRLVGPTEPPRHNVTFHPYFQAESANFTIHYPAFCQIGCTIFFNRAPEVQKCKVNCDTLYTYKVTVGYNDIYEKARMECRDGCGIAMLTCQAGYFCKDGHMEPCPRGTYREVDAAFNDRCVSCPPGKYQNILGSPSIDLCTDCPAGTYADVYGSRAVTDCRRCPAGKYGNTPGMAECLCINPFSCDEDAPTGWLKSTPWWDSYDISDATVPFQGRW